MLTSFNNNNKFNNKFNNNLYKYCIQATNHSMKKYLNKNVNKCVDNNLVIKDTITMPNYNLLFPICIFLSCSSFFYYFCKNK